MNQLTQNNHFKFGRLPEDEQTFAVSVEPCKRRPRLGLEEAILCAQYIYDNYPTEKIKLCLSGGIDSECMAYAFLKAKVPFEAVFLKFNANLNDFDIKTNVEFCQQNNIPYRFIDMDIIDFFDRGESLEISKKYECQSPQLATHLWLLDQIDGLPILAGNPIAPIWKSEHWYYLGLPGELHSVYFKYFLLQNRPGIPFFFLYSPELISSFFKTPIMKNYTQQKVLIESDYTYLHKCQSYNECGFTAKPRLDKFTGFELVRKHYDEIHRTQFGLAFDQLFRKPLEEIFPFPEKYLQYVPLNYF